MPGKYYDQLEIDQIIPHQVRRTVTDTDNVLVTTLTHNTQPLHLDAEFGAGTEFGRVIVNSVYTFGLMVGVSVADTTQGTLVANLSYDAVVFPKPVFIGDTLRFETQVLEKRDSKSRPDAGIVIMESRAFNQRGETVARCKRTALMRKSP